MDCFITDYEIREDIDKNMLVALEDSIMQKGKPVTVGSKILESFVSPFDAAVVTRLQDEGYIIAGKTAMDEFGIAKLFDESGDIPGAVSAVADGAVKFALCNDFSGTVRRQSPENGVCYIHPAYGTVSRFGLIPMISSMDQIGIVCKDHPEGFKLLSIIAGNDPRDGAMLPAETMDLKTGNNKIKAGIPSNVMAIAAVKDKSAVDGLVGKFETVPCELKYFEIFKQMQYILGCAEISNNISRYDGIKFGYRTRDYRSLNDLYLRTRTEGFGTDTKLAAIMGAMVLSNEYYAPYYEKAMKMRRMVKESLEFGMYDVLILPSHINGGAYEQTGLYALATLAGLACVSIPYQCGGIQLLTEAGNEGALLTALSSLV